MKRHPQNSILFLLPSVKIGGGNRVVFELANGLVKKCHIALWHPKEPGKCYYNAAPGIRVRAIGFSGDSLIIRAINIMLLFFLTSLSAKRFKHIISTGQILGPFLIFIPKETVYNFIQADDLLIFSDLALLRNKFIYGIYKLFTRLSYRYPNVRFIFNSRYSYRRFLENSSRFNVPRALVRPGIDPDVFNHDRLQKKGGGKKLRLAYLGRFHPIKGLQTMITAFDLLPVDTKQKLTVTIVSHDNLTAYDIPREWRVESPLNDTTLAKILRSSDLFVSTSLSEGFGLPALEAMACGCAVILSENGGSSEYARPGQNCLVYHPRDSRALARHIIRLVDDEKLRKQISHQAVITAGHFTWRRSLEELSQILDNE